MLGQYEKAISISNMIEIVFFLYYDVRKYY
ncbi:hypothetical protein UM500_13305 [Staphylococcus aureus]|nr:hypothetical protein UM697_10090 [Staphylococcus aureus]WRN06440.1 hypothetical protein UM707_12460 [Staphylococcus aureus]WRN10023.1 hypothetical protein UM646_01820 [Staphylococcus aureus]WRN68252.1 hypothetical protein UM538_03505 [Staphylococcus aureus]WRN90099.1 hypothetical protein T8986_00270 [Staphylococcus aureus]